MDFNTLTPENQAKYLALEKKMFSGKKPKLQSVCNSLKIPFYEGFMWWSHMQKNHASPIPVPVVYAKKQAAPPADPQPDTCPSCGKLKDDVQDMQVCRDVFHYL